MMNRFVLYHAFCMDGFGGAWAAWKKLGDQAEYIPVTHGDPPPALPAGSDVTVIDFAYSRAVMLELAAHAERLQVLDHHKTAERDLAGLPFATFDLNKSGAVLAWEHFHPGEPVPELLRYVEDRDLWRFALPNSQEVSAALASYPVELEMWDRLDVGALAEEGTAILRFRGRVVEELCGLARFSDVGGHMVPIVNTPSFTSDVGEALLRRFQDAPFVALYFDDAAGQRRWSLRSRGDFDVAELAAKFGGGGHPSSAGFAEMP